eukprot:gene19032-biopygen5806
MYAWGVRKCDGVQGGLRFWSENGQLFSGIDACSYRSEHVFGQGRHCEVGQSMFFEQGVDPHETDSDVALHVQVSLRVVPRGRPGSTLNRAKSTVFRGDSYASNSYETLLYN